MRRDGAAGQQVKPFERPPSQEHLWTTVASVSSGRRVPTPNVCVEKINEIEDFETNNVIKRGRQDELNEQKILQQDPRLDANNLPKKAKKRQ